MHRHLIHRLAGSWLIVLILTVMISGTALAGPYSLNRDSIPDQYKWDLNHIYPDWDAWEEGMVELQSMMDEYAGLKGTLADGPDQLFKAHKLYDDLNMVLYKVWRYPGLAYSLDTRNSDVFGKYQRVQTAYAKFGTATAWFTPELLAIPWETMEGWLNENDKLAPYRYGIEDTYRQQRHVLTEEQETLLSYFGPANRAVGEAYAQLTTADIQYAKTKLSEGDSIIMTPGNYYSTLASNRSQDDRRKAFKSFYGVYHANVNTYAAIYNGVLQRDWASAQARNYGSCLEAALDGDNVPTDVYKNLVSTVKAGTEPVKRYYKLRQEVMGLEEYHLYDGSIPLVEFDKTYKYDEIVDWVIDAAAPLGKDYQKQMREAFDNRWIDVYENEGKRTGAFSAGVYDVHPYLLLNFNETLNNVFTVAHEVGHCMHTILSQENQPFATSDYTIFVAEVASTLNEALFLEYMFDRTDDPVERVALLSQAIDNILGTFYTQSMWADYEMRAHEAVEQGKPMTAESIRELYTQVFEEYEGGAVELDDFYKSTWTRIGHFYRSPYYVYKYATCFASSAQLVKGIKSDDKKVREESLDKYLTLLKSGGNDYPMEQLKKAGVDLSQPEAIEAVVAQLDDLVNRLDEELKRLPKISDS